jgi:ABC-type transport system involved in multi-copper enzyme maturation permease subunit
MSEAMSSSAEVGQRLPTMQALIGAELRKLWSRTVTRLTLLFLVLLAVGVPVVLFALSFAIKQPEDAPTEVTDLFSLSVYAALRVVLGIRNLFIFRALIITAVAVTVAGEITARTLREDLLRPVERTQVLVAKWAALQVFVAAGVLVPLALGVPVSLALFQSLGDVSATLSSYGLVWLGDVGFCTFVVAISLVLRSVPGTIAGVLLYWVLDQLLGWFLFAVEQGRGAIIGLLTRFKMEELSWVVDLMVQVRPWLPSSAFNVYAEYDPTLPFAWKSFLALAVLTAASFTVSLLTFQRMDVD